MTFLPDLKRVAEALDRQIAGARARAVRGLAQLPMAAIVEDLQLDRFVPDAWLFGVESEIA